LCIADSGTGVEPEIKLFLSINGIPNDSPALSIKNCNFFVFDACDVITYFSLNNESGRAMIAAKYEKYVERQEEDTALRKRPDVM
jgi:hypothetical protein